VFRRKGAQRGDRPHLTERSALTTPQIAPIREVAPEDICCVDWKVRNRSSELMFTAAYSRFGSAVLKAHMKLSHVTAALLLPVAPPTVDDMDEQLASLSHLSCNVPKLSLAYSVPNSVPLDGIAAAVGEAVRSFDVRAVKLHPNISCIDPESDAGME